jgi:hypothetical protein
MKHPMVNLINPDVSNNHSLRKVSMDAINRNGITYTLQPSMKNDGTIPNVPVDVPEEDTSTNLIFQMIDDQWKKKTNKDSQEKEHGQVPELVQVQVPVLEQVLEQTRSRVNQGQW